jgi:hypothetical protein
MRRPVWSVTGWGITCVKTSRYVMSLGFDKTLYQTGMIFNTKAHTKAETLVCPYIPGQL